MSAVCGSIQGRYFSSRTRDIGVIAIPNRTLGERCFGKETTNKVWLLWDRFGLILVSRSEGYSLNCSVANVYDMQAKTRVVSTVSQKRELPADCSLST